MAAALAFVLATGSYQVTNCEAKTKTGGHASAKHALSAKRHAKIHRVHVARHVKSRAKPAVHEASRTAKPAGDVLSRAQVLATDPAALERIGRHVVVGYEGFAGVKALVERRAIAGIFITDHNVKGRPVAQIKSDIDTLQNIRRSQGLPPLIVAADQEGGSVSRLSPPLKRQPSLARILASTKDDAARRGVVESYARAQAAELKRIGVTMNFAPVVDLNSDPDRRNDGETHLRLRAIAADPELVAKVAGWYCDVLAADGLMCTMKHFPGLGRVGRDTHVASGEISAPESQLKARDWVPFLSLMNRPNVATMLAHVRITAIDKETPASFSQRIIGDMMRDSWHHDGVLITDDLSMGAIGRTKDGAGGAAVKALNAGADLILISFNEKDLNTVMTTLVKADASGHLDPIIGDKSSERLARTFKQARESAIP